MNREQRAKTSDTLLGLSKNVLSIFVIGGLFPGSPIMLFHIILAIIFALAIYGFAMFLLKGDNDND